MIVIIQVIAFILLVLTAMCESFTQHNFLSSLPAHRPFTSSPSPPSSLHMKSSGGIMVEDVKSFDRLVLNPISNVESVKLVFYTAPWCGPCRLTRPSVAAVVEEYKLTNDVECFEVRRSGVRGGVGGAGGVGQLESSRKLKPLTNPLILLLRFRSSTQGNHRRRPRNTRSCGGRKHTHNTAVRKGEADGLLRGERGRGECRRSEGRLERLTTFHSSLRSSFARSSLRSSQTVLMNVVKSTLKKNKG